MVKLASSVRNLDWETWPIFLPGIFIEFFLLNFRRIFSPGQSMRRPLILALSLLGLARLASTKPQPGLDVESVADKIIKKIGENFNLFLDNFGTSIVLDNGLKRQHFENKMAQTLIFDPNNLIFFIFCNLKRLKNTPIYVAVF